ncbi:MAG: PIN domain-containing protein [Defluviitaleaceae bacterium]|nr:PIN domain-containing protein [Defluviitaleaceae bacterium]
MKYALDTNVIFRYLKNELPSVTNINSALADNHKLYIPKMVDYEVRRGFKLMHQPSHRKEHVYKLLTQRCPVIEMDTIIWERAIDVYKDLYCKGFTVGELDILIAAFCLVYDCAIVTNNIKDFENIDGLVIWDWTQSIMM